jgi:hypothetical protein
MALTVGEIDQLAHAAKILNAEVAGSALLKEPIPDHLTMHDLDMIIRDLDVEGELRRNIQVADEVLRNAAEAFADFHDAATRGAMRPPTDAEISAFKDKLHKLHDHAQADQRLEVAAKFAGALADTIGELA